MAKAKRSAYVLQACIEDQVYISEGQAHVYAAHAGKKYNIRISLSTRMDVSRIHLDVT